MSQARYHIDIHGAPALCQAKTESSCGKVKQGDDFHGSLEETIVEAESRLRRAHEAIKTLSKDDIASNLKAFPEIREEYHRTVDSRGQEAGKHFLIEAFAANRLTNEPRVQSIFKTLSRDPSNEIRAFLTSIMAYGNKISEETQLVLAKDDNIAVRRSLAFSCSPTVIKKMADDESISVRRLLAINAALTAPEYLKDIVQNIDVNKHKKEDIILFYKKLSEDDNVTVEALKEMVLFLSDKDDQDFKKLHEELSRRIL